VNHYILSMLTGKTVYFTTSPLRVPIVQVRADLVTVFEVKIIYR
jgi:hypothetical protein